MNVTRCFMALFCVCMAINSVMAADFPSKVQGVWLAIGQITSNCKASDWKNGHSDNDRLISVDRRSIIFHDSSCNLASAKATERETTNMVLACNSEGDHWKNQQTWKVETVQGNNILIISTPEDSSIWVYTRCR